MRTYYSPRQVAELSNLSVKTIYSLMHNGKLGYSKLGTGRGSRIRISDEDIDRMMALTRRKPFAQEV